MKSSTFYLVVVGAQHHDLLDIVCDVILGEWYVGVWFVSIWKVDEMYISLKNTNFITRFGK